jgi:hypothetical protein
MHRACDESVGIACGADKNLRRNYAKAHQRDLYIPQWRNRQPTQMGGGVRRGERRRIARCNRGQFYVSRVGQDPPSGPNADRECWTKAQTRPSDSRSMHRRISSPPVLQTDSSGELARNSCSRPGVSGGGSLNSPGGRRLIEPGGNMTGR